MILSVWFALLMCNKCFALSKYSEHLKEKFEKTFSNKCNKYPFVQRYVEKLESPGDRYLIYIYQQKGIFNGGLGDRLSGLISAMAMSIRLNRTLLIKAEKDMGNLFRPYHPVDIHDMNPKFHWHDWTGWSNYNMQYMSNDTTMEFNLLDCKNTPLNYLSHCGLNDGDVHQRSILFSGNRCYLCFWDNSINTTANKQMNEILGVNRTSDLYEVAGCLLRLVLWPTDFLFNKVGKLYDDFENTLPATTQAVLNHHNPTFSEPFYQVSLHFRCGDMTFAEGGNQSTQTAEASCKTNNRYGTTNELVSCANEVLHHHDTSRLTHEHNHPHNISIKHNNHKVASSMAFITSDNPESAQQMNASLHHPNTLISPPATCHVEMDMSAECHLFTVSYWLMMSFSDAIVTQSEGTVPNVAYSGAFSAFSRYAGIYGLKEAPFRDARHCGQIPSNRQMSRYQCSNWVC